MSEATTPSASRQRNYLPLFWFWGVNLILVSIDPDSSAAYRGVLIGVVTIPLLIAGVTTFSHPEWFARKKNRLLHALFWVGGALIYRYLTTTAWWIKALKADVREGQTGNIDFDVTRLTQSSDRLNDGLVIVLGAVVALALFLWLRGTPFSEIGVDPPRPDTSRP